MKRHLEKLAGIAFALLSHRDRDRNESGLKDNSQPDADVKRTRLAQQTAILMVANQFRFLALVRRFDKLFRDAVVV